MQQVAEWLEKLGMSEYAERFAESDIDTAAADSLKVLDPERPIREADIEQEPVIPIREITA